MDPEPSLFLQYILDTNLVFGFLAIFALLFCSAIVSGAEVALFSLSQKDIDDTIQENPSKGKIISELLEKPKKLLATLLVANNFINIGVVILFSYVGHNIFSAVSSAVLKFILEVIVVTLANSEATPNPFLLFTYKLYFTILPDGLVNKPPK